MTPAVWQQWMAGSLVFAAAAGVAYWLRYGRKGF